MLMQVGVTNTEVPCSEFVDLVKNLLKSPEEREHFFQVSVTLTCSVYQYCLDPELYVRSRQMVVHLFCSRFQPLKRRFPCSCWQVLVFYVFLD